jgi:hypothetical protein
MILEDASCDLFPLLPLALFSSTITWAFTFNVTNGDLYSLFCTSIGTLDVPKTALLELSFH